MSQQFLAIFENGVLRPEQPLALADGQRVTVTIVEGDPVLDDLSDVADLLDLDFMRACRERAKEAPSLEEVQEALSKFKGSVSDLVIQEREE